MVFLLIHTKFIFGVRPKVDANSSLHDEDYVDYVRMLPSYYRGQAHNVTDSGFDYSFVFSLDDIRIDTTTNSVTYTSGSRQASSNKSYTATNGFSALLDKDVKQFVVPLLVALMVLILKKKNHLITLIFKQQHQIQQIILFTL